MPLYFFSIEDRYVDRDGTELADDEEARRQAVIFAADTLHDDPGMVRHAGRTVSVQVRNAGGDVLLTVEMGSRPPTDLA